MKRRHALHLLACSLAMPHSAQDIRESRRWQIRFDANSLKGWKANAKSPHSKASGNTTAGNWRVEHGVIFGSQDKPGNGGLLLTEEMFGD